MKRIFAFILAAIIIAATFCGCAITAERTTPYPTARNDVPYNPPGYGLEDNAPYDGSITPRGNMDTAPVR